MLTAPLPPVSGGGGEEGGEEAQDAALAQEIIFGMQYPPECQGRSAVVFSFDGAMWGLAVYTFYCCLYILFRIYTIEF